MSTFTIPNPFKQKNRWKIGLQGVVGIIYLFLGGYKLADEKYFLGSFMAIGGLLFIYNAYRLSKKGPIGFFNINHEGIKYVLEPLMPEVFIPWTDIKMVYIGKYTMQYLDGDQQANAIELEVFEDKKMQILKEELITSLKLHGIPISEKVLIHDEV